jgi:small ligand-binding sensory domain FIST
MNKLENVFKILTCLIGSVVSWSPAISFSSRTQQPSMTTTSLPALSPIGEEVSSSSWQSHISTHPQAKSALQKVLNEVGGGKPDVAFLFVSQPHALEFDSLVQLASSHFGPDTELISLVGGGVVGDNRELDMPNQPGISIFTGTLPEGAIFEVCNPSSMSLAPDDENADYLIFADPWSDVEKMVNRLPDNSVSAGGISCPVSQDQSSLAYQNQGLPAGTVLAIKLSGSIGLQTVVAQGCRPIGDESLRITELYKKQVITKLNDKPALEVLQEVTNNASPEDHSLIETGLLCGVASSDGKGDYLSRQITGFLPSLGGIVVGTSNLKEGDKFCFQVRDGEIAQQDLKWMVDRAKAARLVGGVGRPLAALQVSCVARGRGMFGVPNVDIAQIKEMLPNQPIGGFFANGEIGPVGISDSFGKNLQNKPSHVHGFTTVVAVIYEKVEEELAGNADFLNAWE